MRYATSGFENILSFYVGRPLLADTAVSGDGQECPSYMIFGNTLASNCFDHSVVPRLRNKCLFSQALIEKTFHPPTARPPQPFSRTTPLRKGA